MCLPLPTSSLLSLHKYPRKLRWGWGRINFHLQFMCYPETHLILIQIFNAHLPSLPISNLYKKSSIAITVFKLLTFTPSPQHQGAPPNRGFSAPCSSSSLGPPSTSSITSYISFSLSHQFSLVFEVLANIFGTSPNHISFKIVQEADISEHQETQRPQTSLCRPKPLLDLDTSQYTVCCHQFVLDLHRLPNIQILCMGFSFLLVKRMLSNTRTAWPPCALRRAGAWKAVCNQTTAVTQGSMRMGCGPFYKISRAEND